MNKIKVIIICLLVFFIALMAFAFLRIKHKEEYQQKVVLAQEIRKVLDYLMFDLREAREGSFEGVPADGSWHHRIAFDRARQGALEYIIRDGHLFRINNAKSQLIADHIADMRIRRQKATPDILEVQIKAQNNVALISNLKVRVRE